MQAATLNGLLSATQTELPLSERARELLSRATILVRAIDGGSHAVLFPIPPDSVLEGPREDFRAREVAWLREAPADERIAYRLEVERVKYRTIALASLDPRLTPDEAERLGDDASAIYLGILEFSGLLKNPAPAAEPAPDATVAA